MKKIIFLFIVLFFLVAGCKALAEESLPNPGTLPDSPFYFLERISEAVGTFFTFGDLKKAERYASLAAERLAEAKAVVKKGKSELAEKTLEKYETQLEKSMARAEKAQTKGENTEKIMEVMTRVGQATSKHLEVLAEVYEKVPEQAKPAIEQAIKVSIKGHEKAVEVLKTKNALGEIPEKVSLPTKVPQEVRERIQSKVQQELEEEKVKKVKEYLQSFESFEALKNFCIEKGAPPETCASLESKCKERGITTPNECFRAASTATIKSSIKPPLSEEELEERRRNEGEEKNRIEEKRILPNQ